MLIKNKVNKNNVGVLALTTFSSVLILNSFYNQNNKVVAHADTVKQTSAQIQNGGGGVTDSKLVSPSNQQQKDDKIAEAEQNGITIIKQKDKIFESNTNQEFINNNKKANADYQNQINKINNLIQDKQNYEKQLADYNSQKFNIEQQNKQSQQQYQKDFNKYYNDKTNNEKANQKIDQENAQVQKNYQQELNEINDKNKAIDNENAAAKVNYQKALDKYNQELSKYSKLPILVDNHNGLQIIGSTGKSGLNYYDNISLLDNNKNDNITWIQSVRWNDDTQLSGKDLITNNNNQVSLTIIKDNNEFESANINDFKTAKNINWYDLTQMCANSDTLYLTNVATDLNGRKIDMSIKFAPFDALPGQKLEDKNVLVLFKAPDGSLEFNMNSKKVMSTNLDKITFYYHNDPDKKSLNAGLTSIIADIDEGQSFDTNFGNQLVYNDKNSNVVVNKDNISLKDKTIHDNLMYSAPQGTVVLAGTGSSFDFHYHQMSVQDAKNIFHNNGTIYDRGTWFNMFGAKTSLNSIVKPTLPTPLAHYKLPEKPILKGHITFTETMPHMPVLKAIPNMPIKPKLLMNTYNILLKKNIVAKANIKMPETHQFVKPQQLKPQTVTPTPKQQSIVNNGTKVILPTSTVEKVQQIPQQALTNNLIQTNTNNEQHNIALLTMAGGTLMLGFTGIAKKKYE